MNLLAELDEFVNEFKARPYIDLPLPAEMDEKVWALLIKVDQAGAEDKKAFESKLTLKQCHLLVVFAARMANLALRKKKKEYLSRGLRALDLCFGIEDDRDIWVVMALFCDAAKRLAVNLAGLVPPGCPKIKETVDVFLTRKDLDHILESMRYVLTKDAQGEWLYERRGD